MREIVKHFRIYLIVKIMYIVVAFQAGRDIAGFSPDQMLVFIGTSISYRPSRADGSFDTLTTKPVSLQFIATRRPPRRRHHRSLLVLQQCAHDRHDKVGQAIGSFVIPMSSSRAFPSLFALSGMSGVQMIWGGAVAPIVFIAIRLGREDHELLERQRLMPRRRSRYSGRLELELARFVDREGKPAPS